MDKNTSLFLIPAAGFGKRVGAPHAKELFPDPETGRPQIDFALELAEKNGASAHVITRREKTQLIEYLNDVWRSRVPLTLQFVDPTSEWPQTLLLSKNHWHQNNVVLLPDTKFEPVQAVSQLLTSLESGKDCSFLTFTPEGEDFSTWGTVDASNTSELHGMEKPLAHHLGSFEDPRAWGVFGFRKLHGETLLRELLKSTLDRVPYKIPSISVGYFALKSFKDLAR